MRFTSLRYMNYINNASLFIFIFLITTVVDILNTCNITHFCLKFIELILENKCIQLFVKKKTAFI